MGGSSKRIAATLLVVAATLAASLVPATADAAPVAADHVVRQSGVRALGFEAALAREVNALRSRHGLRELRSVRGLRTAADAHSAAMLRHGFFAHESIDGTSFSDRLRRYFTPVGSTWSVGENLAMFGPGRLAARRVVLLWMGSPPHRRNLLAPGWRSLGISARFAPNAGGAFGGNPTWVVTLDLGARTTR